MPQIETTRDVKNKIIKVDFAGPGFERVIIRFPRPRGRAMSAPQCAPPSTPPVHPPGTSSTPDAFAKVLLVNQTALACTAASALTGQDVAPGRLISVYRDNGR